MKSVQCTNSVDWTIIGTYISWGHITVVDDAALHSLLKRVRDLGMPSLSVNRVEPGRSDEVDA